MKFRSRFAVVGTLLAVALALLTVLPALALDSTRTASGGGVTLTVSVHESDATSPDTTNAQDTRVLNPGGGVTVWVAGSSKDNAYNLVRVAIAADAGNSLGTVVPVAANAATQGYGVSVTNASSRQSLQIKRQRMTTGGALLYTDGESVGTWDQFIDPSVAAPLTYLGPADPGTGNDPAEITIRRAMETVDGRLPIDDTTANATFFVVGSGSAAPVGAHGEGAANTTTVTRAADATTTTQATDLSSALATPNMYFLVTTNNDEIAVTARGTVAIGGATATDFTVGNDFTLKVDSRGPDIAGIAPVGGTNQSSDSALFGATFTDPGSGLIDDGERASYTGPGTTQAVAPDADTDDITKGEPLSVVGGATRDINIHVAKVVSPTSKPTAAFEFAAATDITSKGSSSWRPVTDGFSVSISESPLGATSSGGVVYYAFLAKDRVGNVSISGLGGPNEMDNHSLIIDRSPPVISSALAGKGYPSSSTPTVDSNDLKSIKVVFSGGIANNAVETLDTDTIEASDFSVTGADGAEMEVVGVNTSPVSAPTDANPDATVNNIVYLELANDLPPAATPRVSVVGSISDLAGNRVGAGSSGGTIVATDKTSPVFSISAVGSVTDRVAATGKRDGQITIRVAANEALRNVPALQVASLVLDGTAIEVGSRNVLSKGLSAVQGVANTWELTTGLTPSTGEGLYAVYVTGDDRSPVPNEGGAAAPVVGFELDADARAKLTLFEIDNSLSLADGTTEKDFVLTPSPSAGKTQSINPFIRVNFGEASEYALDTHKSVTLTKLVLRDANSDETDLLGTEGTVDTDSFLVSLSDLALGKYTLVVNGTDELGNTMERSATFDFEVIQRPAHSVSLWPGNNLVSVPGEPVDPSIDEVLPSSHPATAVLAYDPTSPVGPWLAATRDAGGTWSGPLTEINQGRGYWVDTTTFAPLKVQLRERGSGEVPPTFQITAGWNLIGVVAASNDALNESVAAKDYLASINWSVAYTYNTGSNDWTKITKTTTEPTPGADKTLGTDDDGTQPSQLTPGQGVWVWAESADVLAP